MTGTPQGLYIAPHARCDYPYLFVVFSYVVQLIVFFCTPLSEEVAEEKNNPWICGVCRFVETVSKLFGFGQSENDGYFLVDLDQLFFAFSLHLKRIF